MIFSGLPLILLLLWQYLKAFDASISRYTKLAASLAGDRNASGTTGRHKQE
jgi:hypothetical protein